MAETCCEMTHSHLMKWQMAKINDGKLSSFTPMQPQTNPYSKILQCIIQIPLPSQIMLKYTPKYKFKD